MGPEPKWVNDHKVEWHYVDPGKAQQDGYIERCNGSLRDECLNEEIVRRRAGEDETRRTNNRLAQHCGGL
jgi:hypothetical protein